MKKIHLYDSVSKEIKEVPLSENEKNYMYVCGPTVYNHAHIGNARPLVVFDTLKRSILACGYDLALISNYTDVDDKIINASIKENITEKELTDKYINAYEKLKTDLNVLPVDYRPRVTEYMPKIIDFIDNLVKTDYAYVIDGDVYFRVSKIKSYGSLSNKNLDELKVGARIEENDKKENPLDFTLWKKTDTGIKWDSPWSKGRPGWHTECVCMIHEITPEHHVVIHGGGMDLKFPHHENEQAQAMAYYNRPLADIWVHNGMVNINNEKMSKSLNNFIYAKDLLLKYDGNILRWVFLSTHYRAPINFSDEVFNQAITELNKIYLVLKQAYVKLSLEDYDISSNNINSEKYDEFLNALADDLNTTLAISVIFEMVKLLNVSIRTNNLDKELVLQNCNTINKMLDVLGIHTLVVKLNEEDKKLYQEWTNYKSQKDFENADRIRNILIQRGIL